MNLRITSRRWLRLVTRVDQTNSVLSLKGSCVRDANSRDIATPMARSPTTLTRVRNMSSRRSRSSASVTDPAKRAVREVSDKVLIQQLKELEADGVLRRNDYKEVPPRVDYTLTQTGQSLAQALEPLCIWGTENMAEMQKIFAARDTWVRAKRT